MSEALLRLYAPEECAPTGYPFAWREINAAVCEAAGHRCVRCGHPYRKGQHGNGEWSPCDEQCEHSGPIRHKGETYVGSAPAGQLVGIGCDVEAQWRILTVHHLTGVKADCRWWNLCALDQRCHLQVQGRVRLERVWPWPHTEWFKPFVAGYYAWVYRNEDLSRDEVMGRLDELLALELVS